MGLPRASGGQSLDNAFHVYRVERWPNETRFYRDGNMSYTQAQPNSDDQSPLVRNYAATSDLEVDWIRVRTVVSPAPAVTLGAEEAGTF